MASDGDRSKVGYFAGAIGGMAVGYNSVDGVVLSDIVAHVYGAAGAVVGVVLAMCIRHLIRRDFGGSAE